MAHVTIISG